MSFWLYQIAYVLVMFIAVPIGMFSPKLRRGLRGRWGLNSRVRAFRSTQAKRPLWFHVASSGELEQSLPVMDHLKRVNPEIPLFLTYFSPTAESAIGKERKRRQAAGLCVPWDAADYAPFDLFWLANSFAKTLSPAALVCVHREIWPAIIRACIKRKIKLSLIAAYFPEASSARLRWLLPWLSVFDFIGTTGPSTAARLKFWFDPGGPAIEPLGDPRIERVDQRKRMRPKSNWMQHFTGPVLMISSCWDEDFEAISEGLDRVLREEPHWQIIVAPHEPTEAMVGEIAAFFENHVVPVQRWSQWVEHPEVRAHLVVDQVGQLAELYEIATVVFVGGSFRRRVHNVLEPAAYAKPVITGPFIENSGEAVEMLSEGALIRAKDSTEFSDLLLRLVRDPLLRATLGEKMGNYLSMRQGSSERYAAILIPWAVED